MSKKEFLKNIDLIIGDCVQEMAKLDDNSVDAIVTDPPYGLKFMGKEFDDLGEGAQQREWHKAWAAEALRVLKPGGHLIAFGGTRTYHHLATAVEEVGFEVRDQIQWLYGSGFPKSHNVGKAIDRKKDNKKDILKVTKWIRSFTPENISISKFRTILNKKILNIEHSGGSAQEWTSITFDGRTKPRVPTLDQVPKLLEVLKVKEKDVPDDIARLLLDLNGKKGQPGENWFKREVVGERITGAALSGGLSAVELETGGTDFGSGQNLVTITAPATEEAARWEGWGTALKPANEPCVLAIKPDKENNQEQIKIENPRFIYCPKAGKKERTAGIPDGNKHPTVKPIKVMSYLIEMVSKENDLILDPFVGSGSTGLSAIETNRRFIGIEKDPKYMKIAKARLKYKLEETDGQKRKTQ